MEGDGLAYLQSLAYHFDRHIEENHENTQLN
jgi:hypothetical protein